jgi:hypothetical protein
MLTIKFVDGELVQNVGWNSLPNKVIRYMDYKIGNQTIRFMGFERYLALKEMVYGLNVKIDRASKMILVGQTDVMCTKLTLDLINFTCKKEEVPFQELYNGQSIADNLWKSGEILDSPNVFIRKD